MKVSVVTAYTPTPENRKGISGLIYSILNARPKDVEIKIYSYNFNGLSSSEVAEMAKALSTEIVVMQKPKWARMFKNVWMTRFNKFCMKLPLECYMMPDKQLIEKLRADASDFVWIYPYFFYRLAKAMPEQQFVVSGCDCEALIRARAFQSKVFLSDEKKLRHNYLMLKKGLRFESEWNQPNLRVHFVGMEDFKFYKKVYGYHNAHFLLHPYYSVHEKVIDFDKKKLKVILAGSYDLYTKEDVDQMIPDFIKYKDQLAEHFEFTFLGKHWQHVQQTLDYAGFHCEFKTWVEDYAAELNQNDIQLTPISYGTGTKGKVLSALANGLLVVGSPYAFENICVRHKDSCLCYQNAHEIVPLLLSVANNKSFYQQVAEKGRAQVLIYHNPERISKRFFAIYGNEK